MTDLIEHKAITEVYASDTTTRFAKALLDLISPRLRHQMLFVAFLPIKFELPCIVSPEKYKAVCDRYISDFNKDDIWLKRSPIGPTVKFVRHSDHTPPDMLRRSIFYRQVLKPMDGEFGASMTAWHDETWLATFTMVKNRSQGDFTNLEMRSIAVWQIHFESVARRLAFKREDRLGDQSLATFIWDLPTSVLILEWDLSPKHFNAAAVELGNVWQQGLSAFRKKSSHQAPKVPREIISEVPQLKLQIEASKLARPGPLRRVDLKTLYHPSIEGLSAKLSFIPSKTLSLSPGHFLVQYFYHPQLSSASGAFTDLSGLSRRERRVALEASRGLTNGQIGKLLGKSPGTVKLQLSQVFKKLNLKSRVELANVLSAAGNSN